MFDTSLYGLFQTMAANSERQRDDSGRKSREKQAKGKDFRLSHKPVESEEVQREKEHKDAKVQFGFKVHAYT